MEDLPANSHKSKDENSTSEKGHNKPKKKREVEKIVTSEVTRKKTSLTTKFKNLFFGADFSGVVRYVGSEVLIPALRNLVVDTATKGVERAMYGDTHPRRRGPSSDGVRFRYDTPMQRGPVDPRRSPGHDRQSTRGLRQAGANDIGEIIVAKKEDADRVVEGIIDLVDQFQVASVADLFEMLGLGSTHVDNRWGWTNLPYANTVQTRDGYLINLPPVEPIEI